MKKNEKESSWALFLLLVLFSCNSPISEQKPAQNNLAPDPSRFAQEIEKIQRLPIDTSQSTIVFTGSSSIRMWQDISEYYPDVQIINTGFGGSEMSDLLYYLEETVLRFTPTNVFIYEGDNDINSGRTEAFILENLAKVVQTIHQQLPESSIFLISSKPSIARWHLKQEYESLNRAMQQFSAKRAYCTFVDVWQIMLDEKGALKTDLFIEDGLHMNKKGYDLWDSVISVYVE